MSERSISFAINSAINAQNAAAVGAEDLKSHLSQLGKLLWKQSAVSELPEMPCSNRLGFDFSIGLERFRLLFGRPRIEGKQFRIECFLISALLPDQFHEVDVLHVEEDSSRADCLPSITSDDWTAEFGFGGNLGAAAIVERLLSKSLSLPM